MLLFPLKTKVKKMAWNGNMGSRKPWHPVSEKKALGITKLAATSHMGLLGI